MAQIRGIAFPLQLDGSGGLKMAEDEELVKCWIRTFLETQVGERVMLLDYGTPDYLFNSINNASLIAATLQTRLQEAIPQASFSVTGDISDQGALLLEIQWSVGDLAQEPILLEISN